ncbi:threonylcarbamoyl-AMP synthase [Candidatus Woesebacteria bacterium]|nr:threonylcarbamoyl-AMP synthase [Candidatus Woesebacteria bacterium]
MNMKTIDLKKTSTQEIIDQTSKVLSEGGLIIFPTETTYGAGVDATNPEAVNKLLAYKSRREGKPLSIAVCDKKMASEYVFINEQADKLFDQFLPGPVTVVCKVLEKSEQEFDSKLAPSVASEFNTLGIRIPDYQLILDLLKAYKKPMTATSANGSGKKIPYTIDDILNNISDKQKSLIDLVLDAGELPHNDPSTVIDTTLSAPITLRGKSTEKTTKIISNSEQETQEIAGRIMLKNWNEISKNGLVIALNGSLGTGKTIFAKGVAKFLNINEIIKSPTYTYIEEYDFQRHQTQGKLYHLDMWKVEDKEMFSRLEVETLIAKNNVVIIEWFDQIAQFIDSKLNGANIIKIFITQEENKRSLEIS